MFVSVSSSPVERKCRTFAALARTWSPRSMTIGRYPISARISAANIPQGPKPTMTGLPSDISPPGTSPSIGSPSSSTAQPSAASFSAGMTLSVTTATEHTTVTVLCLVSTERRKMYLSFMSFLSSSGASRTAACSNISPSCAESGARRSLTVICIVILVFR